MTRGRPEPANRDKSTGQYKSGKKGCFIATAVYGDSDAPEVVILRRWRDDKLSRTPAGRAGISIYYKVSPPVAKLLTRVPWLSALVKTLLDTFVRRCQ